METMPVFGWLTLNVLFWAQRVRRVLIVSLFLIAAVAEDAPTNRDEDQQADR